MDILHKGNCSMCVIVSVHNNIVKYCMHDDQTNSRDDVLSEAIYPHWNNLPANCSFTNEHVQLFSCTLSPYNPVVSKLLEKNLLADTLFVRKEIKVTWGHFVTIFVHQCPRPLEISLETAKVFEEHGMMDEAKCLRGEMFTV